MSKSETKEKPSEDEIVSLAAMTLKLAGECLKKSHGTDAQEAYLKIITMMMEQVKELSEWKTKAESKFIDLAADPGPILSHIRWAKIDADTKCLVKGLYMCDGTDNTNIGLVGVGDKFSDIFRNRAGENLHVFGPFQVPN